MSRQEQRLDTDALPEPVCEHCGGPIDDTASECPALEEGWCHP